MRYVFFQFVDNKSGVWQLNGGRFTVASTWKEIRPHRLKVPWYKIVWSAPSIPKHNLIIWMVLLNILPTKDRMIAQGYEC